MDRRVAHLDAQRIRKAFKRKLRAGIRSTPAHRHKAQHRRTVDDPPVPLCAHHWNDLAAQFVDTKEVCFVNLSQALSRQVFDSAGQSKGPIVVERIKRASRALKNLGDGRFYAFA